VTHKVTQEILISVHIMSLQHGFDAEQIQSIWRAASQNYPADELIRIFQPVLSKVPYAITVSDRYQVNPTWRQTLTLEFLKDLKTREGGAFRVLARLVAQHKSQALVGNVEEYLCAPVAPWSAFTYALLKRLAEDGQAEDMPIDYLLARDLGL
jgi:hypothetical protein